MNTCTLSGRLTADPESRATKSGMPVANFSLAVKSTRKNEAGEYIAEFFDFTAFNSTADYITRSFHKGDKILVSGKLCTDKYTDKNGVNRLKSYIMVDNVEFCGSPMNQQKATEAAEPEISEPKTKPAYTGGYRYNR